MTYITDHPFKYWWELPTERNWPIYYWKYDLPATPGYPVPTKDRYEEDAKRQLEEALKLMDVADRLLNHEAGNKYSKNIKGVDVDVYDVLNAFGVQNPALQHLIKKALMPGERGHKDKEKDMKEIIASAKRAAELEGFNGE